MSYTPKSKRTTDKSPAIEDKPPYETPKAIDLGELEQGQGGLPMCIPGSSPSGSCVDGLAATYGCDNGGTFI